MKVYSLMIKNKQYAQSGRLRVNMGNIYFKQKPPKYPMAIKMYRMVSSPLLALHDPNRDLNPTYLTASSWV